jgi:hypothetical protein
VKKIVSERQASYSLRCLTLSIYLYFGKVLGIYIWAYNCGRVSDSDNTRSIMWKIGGGCVFRFRGRGDIDGTKWWYGHGCKGVWGEVKPLAQSWWKAEREQNYDKQKKVEEKE